MKDKLDHLLRQARSSAPFSDADDDGTMPPGLSTRIASRWVAQDDRSLYLALAEHVIACCLVPALTAWMLLTWSKPAATEANVMDLLYTARLVVEVPPPF